MSQDPTRQRGGQQHVSSPTPQQPSPARRRAAWAASAAGSAVTPPGDARQVRLPFDDEDTVVDDASRTDLLDPFGHAAAHSELAAELQRLTGDAARLRTLHWVAQGGDVNAADSTDTTPLMLAASYGHLTTVAYLIGQGARVNAVNASGYTALGLAAARGYRTVVSYLKSRGANPNVPAAWFDAAESGNIATLGLLLAHGAEVSLNDITHDTALIVAARHGHLQAVRLLLTGGSDKNATNCHGDNATRAAIRSGHFGVAAYLETGLTKPPMNPLRLLRYKLLQWW